MEKHLLIIVSGPSGVGKGTIVNKLVEGGGVVTSVSCTTRSPRPGEVNGKDYFFISHEQFQGMIQKDELLEYSNHFANYYGTPKFFVEEQLATKDVILEIEVNGALKAKSVYPQALLLMVAPPSREILKARLLGRGTESEEKVEERLSRYDYEMSKSNLYDYVIVNDDLDEAVKQIRKIILERKVSI